MTSTTERRVRLETCQNFRDLGGYRAAGGRTVRWGRLYRADTLHRLSPDDLALIGDLGIRTVVDLRSTVELDRYGRVQVDPATIDYHHLPMIDEVMDPTRTLPPDPPPTAGESYVSMTARGGANIARAVRLLAEPGRLPAVFHCTAGKDRTGILAGLVLSALGVADGDVVDDYVLTAACRDERDAFLKVHDPDYFAFLQSLPPGARDTRPETMQYYLDTVRAEHGSVRGFLTGQGVGADGLARLEATLLEPAG